VKQVAMGAATVKNSEHKFQRFAVNFNKSNVDLCASTTPSTRRSRHRKLANSDEEGKGGEPGEFTFNKIGVHRCKTEHLVPNPEGREEGGVRHPAPKFLWEKHDSHEGAEAGDKGKPQRMDASTSGEGLHEEKTHSNPFRHKTVGQVNGERWGVSRAISGDDQPKVPLTSGLKLTQVSSCASSSTTTCSKSFTQEESDPPPKIDHFKKLKFLGEGRFGQVHLVVHKETQLLFALKQIKKDTIGRSQKMADQFLMEIKMQFFFEHPNILKLYGIFSDDENIYLIL
jgi:hypothetical protein